MPDRVLIIDDDENILAVLRMRLRAGGYEVVTARSGDEALARLDGVDVVLSDLRLEAEDGLEVMERIRAVDPALPVIILTAHGTIPSAVEAMRRGAEGYLTKPADRDELFAWLRRGVETRRQRQELAGLRRAVAERAELHGVIGASAGMRRVFELIERFGPTDLTVAIHGESGTGKELVARALHRCSPRANRRFVAVNCAAVADTLLQSELFGHVRGAFTGADRDRPGLFTEADGGTLLLDEIGDMSPALQAALLRVLQEREVLPVGGRRPRKVDVRVLVATHRDLRRLVDEGRFREDLYYRVMVAPIHLPPLREREGDALLLADRFLAELAGDRPLRFSEAARRALREHPWPGNVRELRHAVERAVVMANGEVIEPRDLFLHGPEPVRRDPGADAPPSPPPPYREAREAWERDYLARLLRSTGGNVSAAARRAGRNRTDLYALFRKHGIDPADFKR